MVTKKTTTKKAPVKKTSAKTVKVKEPSHIGLVRMMPIWLLIRMQFVDVTSMLFGR